MDSLFVVIYVCSVGEQGEKVNSFVYVLYMEMLYCNDPHNLTEYFTTLKSQGENRI